MSEQMRIVEKWRQETKKKTKESKKETKIPLVHLQQLLLPWSVLICPYCMNPICSHETPRYWEGTTHTDELQSNKEKWSRRLAIKLIV